MQSKRNMMIGIVSLLIIIALAIIVSSAAPNIAINPVNHTWTNETNDTILFEGELTDCDMGSCNCTLVLDDLAAGKQTGMAPLDDILIYANRAIGEGNHTWYFNCTDSSTSSISGIMELHIDRTNPTISITSPANQTSYTDTNNVSFTFTTTDTQAENMSCKLIINGVDNETNTSVSNGVSTTFPNITFSDGLYNWDVNCKDFANNSVNSTTRQFAVGVAPKMIAINVPKNLTGLTTSTTNVYGYVNMSDSNITVYASQLGQVSYTNDTFSTESANYIGMTTVGLEGFNSSHFLLNISSPGANLITTDTFLAFAGHNTSTMTYYDVTGRNGYDATYDQINLSPNLQGDVSQYEVIRIYNQSRPSGWFNITVQLHSGWNNITAIGSRQGYNGPASDKQVVYYDDQLPTINLTPVLNYSTNIPNIYFWLLDDYGLNLSKTSLLFNGGIYNYSNMTCSGTLTNQACNISFDNNLANGSYTLSVTAYDLAQNVNNTGVKNVVINTKKPTINIISPPDGYTESNSNNVSFDFNVTDDYDDGLNCSLYIDDAINQTNTSVQNGTISNFMLYNQIDSEFDWYIKCENTADGYSTTASRRLTISVSPGKPYFWPFSPVTNEINVNLVGVVGTNNTLLNATVTQGEYVPHYNYTTTMQGSHLIVQDETLKEAVSNGTNCIYVNKTLNESFDPGNWVEFANHNKSGAYFERYNITNRSNNWEGLENAYYTKVCLQDNLTEDVPKNTVIEVYDTSLPAGWFNMTVTLNSGPNNVTVRGSRLGIEGPSSDVLSINWDTTAPTINTSSIPGNVSTTTPTINFTVNDGYQVNLSKLLVEISDNAGVISSIFHTTAGSVYSNMSGITFGDNITCSGQATSYDCSFSANLTDGNYSINITVNDTLDNYAEEIVSEFLVVTIVSVVEGVDDGGVTTSTNQIYANWTNQSLDSYFDHYQVSVGTEQYPTEGYNSVNDWFNTTNNFVNESWNITQGYAYYFNVRVVDIFGNLGNVTSSNGIIYEDNTPPSLGFINLTGTSDNNAWTNVPDELSAFWNFTDNQTGISQYEYGIGNDTYPNLGWNSIKDITSTINSSVTAVNLTLKQNVSYYFSVRARNNYQYGYGWSDWYSSTASIKVDTSDPVGGYIDYAYGQYTANSITITYGTGQDNYSGIDRAALMKATAPMDPNNGGVCGGYSSYTEITNVSETGTGLTTTYTYNGLQDGNCYRFALYVWDEAGNRAEYYLGNQVYNVSVDSTPPTSFTVTDDGHITGSTSLDFSWGASTDPESGISHYDYQLEDSDSDVLVSWTNNGLTTSVNMMNLSLVDEETYYLKVRAWNNLGLQTNATSDGITYLDISVPEVLTVDSVSNDTNGSDGWQDYTETSTAVINLSGESGLLCVWSYQDIAFTQPSNATNYSWWCDNSANSTGTYTCTATGITEGYWTLHVTCRDAAGNLQTMNENTDFTLMKESSGPRVTINYPENNSLVNGVVNFNATITDVSDYTAVYEMRSAYNGSLALSGGITNEENIPVETSSLEGQYNFIIYATDEYNRTGNGSITIGINNDAPTVNIEMAKNYYNEDFNFTLRATLYTNLSYNITNSSGSLITSSEWGYQVMQNYTVMSNVSVDVDPLQDGPYTITALAFDDNGTNRTDTEVFYVDRTSPEYKGTVNTTPEVKYENDTVTLYLNWKEVYSMGQVWVRHNANGSFVNYTAEETTPGLQIYENTTRYKLEVPAYMLTTNETVNYTWYARDTAGNEASHPMRIFNITNRAVNITTVNLTEGWANVSYQELIYFTDPDTSQNNLSYFNCTVEGPAGMNISVQSSTVCLLTWNNPTGGNHSVNVTVTDRLLNGGDLNSTTARYNLTILDTVQQNYTINSSHTVKVTYLSGGEIVKTFSSITDRNLTIPKGLYDLRIEIDKLRVNTTGFNASTNLRIFFQKLNNDSIDDNDSDLGPNRTYKPYEAYAFSLNSSHNGSYSVGFNYSSYTITSTDKLKIFKFAYNESTGSINYSDVGNEITVISSGFAQILVSNFSLFVLSHEGEVVVVNNNNNPGGGGGGSGGSGGGGGWSPYTSSTSEPNCSDGIMNQAEVGVDCGGPCDRCITCHDKMQNQGEFGIDCGGPCTVQCTIPTCVDGVMNDGEEGVDCGGPCSPCPGCNNNYWDEGEEGMDCGGVCPNECQSQVVETQIVETPVKETPSYIWLLIIGITLFGGITALWIYNREEKAIKKSKVDTKVEAKQVQELQEEEQSVMSRFIYNYLSRGMTEENVKSQLVMDGFKPPHVDAVMAAVVRDKKIMEIQDYFKNYSQKGYTEEELRDWVLKNGIDQSLVEEALARRQLANDRRLSQDKENPF